MEKLKMVKVINMFREFTMFNVSGYIELPDWQKDLFDATYKKHLSSMEINERICYTENQIAKIVGEESIIRVYFQNKDCFFYLPGKKWVKM